MAHVEHLDCAVVGAGLSGIGAGHYLKTRCAWARFAIFEARGAIGGTWDLFRYPGIRSDSDMFTLGYSFRPWDDDKSIADGASILRYIQDTADESGVLPHIRFHHRVVRAEWSTEESVWHLGVAREDTGDEVELTASFLFTCSGYYRYDRGYLPEFPGMERFSGVLVHPQAWPEDLDHAGMRVAVIGSGATAVTLVPALAREAAHVTMVQRSPTYIASLSAEDPVVNFLRRVLPRRVSGPVSKWFKALLAQGFYVFCQRWPDAAARFLLSMVARQLPAGFDIATHFTPYYKPWDQRLCLVPDGDLFTAIRGGAVSVVTDHIETFTETGLAMKSGVTVDADVIVTATGLELLFAGGIELAVDGTPVDLASCLVYKGMMLEGVPNFAIAVGYTNASWTLKCELICQQVAGLLNHLRKTGTVKCTPVNDDPSIVPEPLLSLSSGYVQRAADRFPKQGSALPWRVHQSYLRDWLVIKRRPLADQGLVFEAAPEVVTARVA